MAVKKTIAMKLLDGKGVPYEAMTYPATLRDAEEVAAALGLPAEQVYKTLVVPRPQPSKSILALLPANRQLDLKRLAKSANEKKLKMAGHRQAEELTGLQVGGISALALLNRGFDVYIDQSAQALQTIVISAGERGQQIALAVPDLVQLTRATFASLARDAAPPQEEGW